MKREERTVEIFYSLLRAGLWGRNAHLSSVGHFDFDAVFELARDQAVLGIVVCGLEQVEDIDWHLPLSIANEVSELELFNKMMSFSIGFFVDKMREACIKVLLVKGQGIAQCYQYPLRRASGDIDFLLDAENYEKAKIFFTPLAQHIGKENVKRKHFNLTIEPWEIELHGTLRSGLSRRIDKELDRIQSETFQGDIRIWNNDGVEVLLPGVDSDVIFVFVHILQHFFREGIGARQICDLCRLLWTYRDSINHTLLESRLRKMRLIREWKVIASYAVEYLGMPAKTIPLFEDSWRMRVRARRINSFIIKVGNFGHNRDNSFYSKYPYFIYKAISLSRHCWDFFRHLFLFPRTSISAFFWILFRGVHAVAEGE